MFGGFGGIFCKSLTMEPVILGSDQMPLHRNENSNEKTLSCKGIDAFVKENHALSRERITLMTTVSSSSALPPPSFELLFKGMGTRTHVELPPHSGITFQWAVKGSYRVANVLEFLDKLPKPSMFTKVLNIYMLDDYSAHLDQSVRKKILERGYIPFYFGGALLSSDFVPRCLGTPENAGVAFPPSFGPQPSGAIEETGTIFDSTLCCVEHHGDP